MEFWGRQQNAVVNCRNSSEGVGLILAVDRILDMSRTTVNVWGDTCAAVIIAKSEGETLNV